MSISDPLVLGTRGSELALRQANVVRSRLEAAGHRVELETITTRGDEATDTPISEIGDEAVFTKELDRALLQGGVDLAVHSLKDIPSTVPSGLALAAIGEREDPRDAFVAHPSFDGHLHDLPEGATVATASLRRTAQLLTWRSDLEVVPVRGNVDTRLEKLGESDWTGMVLAVAGLVRLGLSLHIRDRIDPSLIVPAVGQGALGIACREDQDALRDLLRETLHHAPSGHAANAERAFLKKVGGGCQVPLGAWARIDDGTLVLDACIAALDGSEHYRDERRCAPEDGVAVGRELAADLLAMGGDHILDDVLGESREGTSNSPFRP
ncbi:hydroxymethylbilane synthase [Salinibacter ruber]|uniref:hydroxymethylbilane synthase n=1 Tax=Salinibacter ruber TaxID=146919 RepID=UPI002072E18C|nr:hydroxymethylbilane synthase [Salinibacter ruber]MCS3634265.1 hydroxymethylbilane synthase [Salinibacter ruber]MCS3713755.1 hydroxymethylbilane synthase [Salinibacter ruber]